MVDKARSMAAGSLLRNADARWDGFASEDYWDHNYSQVSPEDERIISLVSGFFGKTLQDQPRTLRGLDAGAGTNLYPSLLMLPWAERLTLIDYSASNVGWLRRELSGTKEPWVWQAFWDESLKQDVGYKEIPEPRARLQDACADRPGESGVRKGSVFDLPPAQWDLGTMFFVAESITEDRDEFCSALRSFVDALKPGSPFATAFMAGSDGYPVADVPYPAVPVTAGQVHECFTKFGASDLNVDLIQLEHKVRPGYDGMIVATGFTSDNHKTR